MHQTADEHLLPQASIRPFAHPISTVNGVVVDTRGFREALIYLNIGTLVATATLDTIIQEDDVVGFGSPTAVVGAVFPQQTQAGGDSDQVLVGRINLEGRQRFLRAQSVVAAAVANHAVSIVLANPRELPVTQDSLSAFQV